MIHINHGMAEHAARYERFADALIQNGYAVYAHDHRGHGKTTAKDAPKGSFGPSGIEAVVDDVLAIRAEAAAAYPEAPIVLFGHSMGAIITFNTLLKHADKFAAGAVWNSGFETGALALVFRGLLRIEQAFKGSDVPSGLATKLTFDDWNKKFAPNRTEFDWLSRDEAEVDKYVADPDCGFPVSVGLWRAVLSAIYFGADDANLAALPKAMPLHITGGEKDPCTLNGKAMQNLHARLKKAGMSDVTLSILANTRHESLNEVNRDETTAGFINWLDERFGRQT